MKEITKTELSTMPLAVMKNKENGTRKLVCKQGNEFFEILDMFDRPLQYMTLTENDAMCEQNECWNYLQTVKTIKGTEIMIYEDMETGEQFFVY